MHLMVKDKSFKQQEGWDEVNLKTVKPGASLEKLVKHLLG